MAHDITFKSTSDKEKKPIYFFGYMAGLFYRHLDAEHCNAGISGTNESVIRTRAQVLRAIEQIERDPACQNYPDPNRFPDFKKEILADDSEEYKITFS